MTSVVGELTTVLLLLLRLTVFGLALGLTLISFQSYRKRGSKRLESAFVGFAFLSMGVAVTTLSSQVSAFETELAIVETIPFIIGFGMLYVSLYR
jgi:hypothetical protein